MTAAGSGPEVWHDELVGYDAVLLLSFGGPERPADVLPFLQNMHRGRRVPPQQLAELAEHYQHFGGVSPNNAHNRALLAALRGEFAAHGLTQRLYWGNRTWHPMLADVLATMRDDGVRRALAFVTSPYGSYPTCRQYLDDLAAARAAVGPRAPAVAKLRHYHDHPGFVDPLVDGVRQALAQLDSIPLESIRLVCTASSIPVVMARTAGPAGGRYEAQLRETAALVARAAAPGLSWDLVWQRQSGPAPEPWLEPDITQYLPLVAGSGVGTVVVSPIGFVADQFEVGWELDTVAADTAKQLGLGFVRAATPGLDHRFVSLIRELVQERLDPTSPRPALGTLPSWDACASHCCAVRGGK